jgi:hypothetical protein
MTADVMTSSQVPVYLAEISSHDKRGAIIVIQQLAIEWGILIMYFIGYGCSFINGPASFRTAWAMQWVPCVCLMLGLPFISESPRWLAKKDRVDEAITILARIHARGDKNDPHVQAEFDEIATTLAAERAAAPGWRKFFYDNMWKRTLAGFSVQAWQQLSGANLLTYFIVYVSYSFSSDLVRFEWGRQAVGSYILPFRFNLRQWTERSACILTL